MLTTSSSRSQIFLSITLREEDLSLTLSGELVDVELQVDSAVPDPAESFPQRRKNFRVRVGETRQWRGVFDCPSH